MRWGLEKGRRKDEGRRGERRYIQEESWIEEVKGEKNGHRRKRRKEKKEK